MSKLTTSRIPTFGTRIPQSGTVPKSKRKDPIGPSDVGKTVSVADKLGILRYVGKVHFASDVWCGIELITGTGKNDGSVDGVAYFDCSSGHGLMTPLSKVAIVKNASLSTTESLAAIASVDEREEHSKDQQLSMFQTTSSLENDNNLNNNTKINDKSQSIEEADEEKPFFIGDTRDEDKRDSLDFDESSGILSVSQMNDDFLQFGLEQSVGEHSPPLSFNLDLILREVPITLISDTTINLELTLDTGDRSDNFGFARLEETPSPEELPLDPIPIIEAEPKSGETTKSKTNNSFVTSITSITSLDTGYQGDGEMSRPGSRGADNSPLTRRPLQRPAQRRADAMTDSDFFTESDADNHDENVLKGDRRVQVIDGTLYGIDPQAAADIYANNRENMDSSGIFTDIETNTRIEELLIDEKIDISPTDTSSKTLSDNSQTNLHEIIAKNQTNTETKKKDALVGETAKKRSPATSTSSHDTQKKYKIAKKDVQSKVKLLLETNAPKAEKKTFVRPAGRWDAVMNKISKSDSKSNFQEVKSRVLSGVSSVGSSNPRQGSGAKTITAKTRRIRTRLLNSTNASKTSNAESVHSSLSDLSSSQPKKTIIGSNKKRDAQINQVLTAGKLSPKLSQQKTGNDAKRKTVVSAPSIETKTSRKILPASKEKKQILIPSKENARNAVKGGRTSPVLKPPAPIVSKPVPKTAEALAILLQHLVFNIGAFDVPYLKKQVSKCQSDVENTRLAYQLLERQLVEEKEEKLKAIEEERSRFRDEIARLMEDHSNSVSQLTVEREQSETFLVSRHELREADIRRQYEEKLSTVKREFEKLQKTHEESLDILREENEAIREDIDAKKEEIRSAKHERSKLRTEYEIRENRLREQLQTLSKENQKFKQELAACKEELAKLEEENARWIEDNKRLLSYGEGKGVGIQEVESLRVVLELKQNEVSDLRKSLAEATQRAEMLAGCEEKAVALQARCEDLQLQLERKNEYELMLISKSNKLEKSLQEENHLRRSVSLRNEELQWKLEQNKEVMTKILEQTGDDFLNRSANLSTSYIDAYSFYSAKSYRSPYSPEISSRKSKKGAAFDDDDDSPPASPKVKGIVEKSDSVSYVLDLDESPEVVASRLVRRSFRNSANGLNQKSSTPTKSPYAKRPGAVKQQNPLRQSSSATSLPAGNKIDYNRSLSMSSRNGDDDGNFSDNSNESSPYRRYFNGSKLSESPEHHQKGDDLDYMDDHIMDLELPALPSQLGSKTRLQPLPSPKHFAGVSESNSEDENTSSSSGQL